MDDVVFIACNALAGLGWFALIALPRARLTGWLVETQLLPLAIAAAYTAIVVGRLVVGDASEGDFASLDGVAALFADRTVLLAGWIHYLAFDLFVGGWELRDAQARGVRHLALVPFLLTTLWVGPAGLLAWRAGRKFLPRLAASGPNTLPAPSPSSPRRHEAP